MVELPPMRVEAKRLPRAVKPVREISVGAGIGAEARENPVNAVGVPIKNMERIADISLERREEIFQLETTKGRRDWVNRAYLRTALDQQMRLRSRGPIDDGILEIELGGKRDRSEIHYWDNRNSPYDNSDDVEGRARRRVDANFMGLRYERGPWQAILESDGEKRDVMSGYYTIGASRTRQWEGDLAFSQGEFQGTAFAFLRRGEFSPNSPSIFATTSHGARWGTQITRDFSEWGKLTISGARENLRRDLRDFSTRNFTRDELELRAGLPLPKIFWLEGEIATTGAYVNDNSDRIRKPRQIWEAGAEFTTPKRYLFGAQGKAKRFARVPRPSEIFGDGALVLPSPNLLDETGWRVAAGPWLKIPELLEIGAEFFAEEAKNATVPLRSGSNARMQAIGGVWTRGAKARVKVERGDYSLESEYSYQDALNAARINTQYGQRLPDRPENTLSSTIAYAHKRFSGGMRHQFVSAEALGLFGDLERAPRHKFGAFFGYNARDWRLLLEGKNLFARRRADSVLEATAGLNVIEPQLEQREISLALEVLL